MNTKKYANYSIFCLLFLLILTVIINRVVDPFWYYRDIQIKDFNAIKTQFHSYELQIKPIIFKEIKPEAVIFSNSFFEIGFDPSHPGFTQNGNYRSYNFGMVAADWDKVYCNVIYAIGNAELKSVIIGIQPGSLPQIDCTQQLKTLGNIEQKTLLLSFDALRGSFNTIRQQNKSPTHTIDGMFYYHRNNSGKIEQVFKFYFDRYLQLTTSKTCTGSMQIDKPLWSYPNDSEDMEGLKNLLNLLVSRNIYVKLIAYPYHALWMELLMSCGDIMGRWHSLYNIATIVEQINKTNDIVELWDFQGTDNMLTERISNDHVRYWQDHGHFNFEMGNAMLDVIFKNKVTPSVHSTDEFGVSLTPNSTIDRFNRFFENRSQFIRQNPWFLEDFAKFAKQK